MILYDSYVFPRIASPFGQIELRISRDTENCFMQNSGGVPLTGRTVLHLAPTRHAINSIGEWVQRQNDEEGRLVADGIEIELKDTWTYEGTLYTGGALTGDVSQFVPGIDGCTFLDALFADETIRYYGWLVFYPGDGTKEIFFAGTIKPPKITRAYSSILAASTTAELVDQKVKIVLNPIADRISDRTAELFVQTMSPEYTVSSEQGLSVAVPWYGGRTTHYPRVVDFETDVVYEDLPYWDGNESTVENGVEIPTLKMITYGAAEKEHRDGGGLGFRDTTYYENVWGIRLARIFDRIATLCGMTVSAPLETDFEYTEQPWDNTNNLYTEQAITDAAAKLAVSYNHAFGVSSYDGVSAYEYPITWKRDTPLTAILRDLCLQLGCYLEWEVEQALGVITLAMTRRRKQRGGRPTAWKVIAEGGGEAERAIAKAYVEVKYRGDDATVRCPAGAKGEGVVLELPFRTRPMGGKAFPVYPTDLLQIDRSKSIYGQAIAFEVPDSEQASFINPDSWVLGAHLFIYYGTAGTNRYYDDSPWVGPVNAGDWEGMYVVRSQTEKAGTWTNRDNALVAAAQYYAREFLGDRVPIERTYYGILSNTGKLQSIKPGMTDSWRVRGALRDFRAKEIRRNLIAGTTTVQWEERPTNYNTLEDLPYQVSYGGSGSSSGGGSPSSSAISTVSSVTQGISGYGLAGAYAVYASSSSLKTARARENGPAGVFDVQGVVADALPAIHGGSVTTGYAQTGVKGRSNSGTGVEGVSTSGSAVKGTTTSGLAGEFVGKTKTTTLQVTGGSPGTGKFLQDSDGAGNAVWAAVPVMTDTVLGLGKYDNVTIKKNGSDQLYTEAGASVQKIMVKRGGADVGEAYTLDFLPASGYVVASVMLDPDPTKGALVTYSLAMPLAIDETLTTAPVSILNRGTGPTLKISNPTSGNKLLVGYADTTSTYEVIGCSQSGLSYRTLTGGVNGVGSVATFTHNSTATTGVGFGGSIILALQYGAVTARDQHAGYIQWEARDVTAGSLNARVRIGAVDSGGSREGIAIEADGTAPRVGFYGVTPVARAAAIAAVGAAPAAYNQAYLQSIADAVNALRTANKDIGITQ